MQINKTEVTQRITFESILNTEGEIISEEKLRIIKRPSYATMY
jgi:hypothetical protein